MLQCLRRNTHGVHVKVVCQRCANSTDLFKFGTNRADNRAVLEPNNTNV
jgi:hypothetical protein